MRGLTAILATAAFLLGSDAIQAKASRSGMFKYSANQSWTVVETTVMDGMPASRSTIENKVIKMLPGGIALVGWKAVKVESGPSLDKLQVVPKSPMLGRQFFRLHAPNGETFQVQSAKVTQVESAIASSMMGDADPVPPKPMSVGERTKLKLGDQEWSVARLKDDEVNGVKCAVYEAKLSSLTRTTCFDLSGGALLRRKISQPGAEMMVVRLKK